MNGVAFGNDFDMDRYFREQRTAFVVTIQLPMKQKLIGAVREG